MKILFILIYCCTISCIHANADIDVITKHLKNGAEFSLSRDTLKCDIHNADLANSDLSINRITCDSAGLQNVTFIGSAKATKDSISISFTHTVAKKVLINYYVLTLEIEHSRIDTLDLRGCDISKLIIKDSEVGYIKLSESVASKLYISQYTAGAVIDISAFYMPPGNVRLSTISLSGINPGEITLLKFDYDTKFENLDIDLSNYILDMDTGCTDCINDNNIHAFFNRELTGFEKGKQDDNYKTLYFYYRKWLVRNGNIFEVFFKYTLPKWFYGFGLEKDLIIRSALIIFLISFILFLLFNSYVMPSYDFELQQVSSRKYVNRFVTTLFATGLIFFGIKIDHKKLKFDSLFGVGLLLLIYLAGIVCYAFLANFIFTVK